MKTYTNHPPECHPCIAGLPLFDWRPAILTPPTRAARKIASRFGLSLVHASTVAGLAGLGFEEEAR